MSHWLIDFDSVLSNTFKHQIELVNERFGLSLTHEDFTDWDTAKVLNEEQIEFMWGPECFLNHEFQMSCTPLNGGATVLEALGADGNTFVVVSDRPQSLYRSTRDWLDWNIGTYPLILTRSNVSKSDRDPSIPTKQDVCRQLGLTKAVDDAPHHALAFAEMPSMEMVYMMDTPSNRFVEEGDKLLRVDTWYDVYDFERRMVLA